MSALPSVIRSTRSTVLLEVLKRDGGTKTLRDLRAALKIRGWTAANVDQAVDDLASHCRVKVQATSWGDILVTTMGERQ